MFAVKVAQPRLRLSDYFFRRGFRSRDRRRHVLLELALRALQHRTCLQPFLHEIRIAAFRALLRNRLAPRYEITIGISIAAVERLAALRASLHDFTFGAFRALHADGFLLDVFARRIIAARGEFAITAMLHDQVIA